MGRRWVWLFSVTGFLGCVTPVGAGNLSVPKDAAATCGKSCANLSMPLGAVVIMAGNVGCVCSAPKGAESAAVAGGMTAIMIEEADEQRRSSAAQGQPAYHH
jgi:hypothetical protein